MKRVNIYGCLCLCLTMLWACSDDAEWTPFSIGGSLDLLPYEEKVVPIEGGVPPYTVKVEVPEAVTVYLETSEEVPEQWLMRVRTHSDKERSSQIWVTDAEGNETSIYVDAHVVSQSFFLKESNLVVPIQLNEEQLSQVQSLIESESFPLEAAMRMDFETPLSGYLTMNYFRDMTFQIDEAREHISFTLPTGETSRFSITPIVKVEDNPDQYAYLRWWALPPVMLLEEDFTDKCREMFPGVLADSDKVALRYYFSVDL